MVIVLSHRGRSTCPMEWARRPRQSALQGRRALHSRPPRREEDEQQLQLARHWAMSSGANKTNYPTNHAHEAHLAQQRQECRALSVL
eukprot:7099624-Pyramimonas_sp.AAC.1